MKNKRNLMFTNKNSHKPNIKVRISILVILTLLSISSYYLISDYNHFINDFKNNFDSNNFSVSNNIAITKNNFNPLKPLLIKDDFKSYFSNKINDISSKLEKNEITKAEALNILYEIDRYIIVQDDITNLISSLSYDGAYSYGVSLYNSGQYTESYNVLSTIRYSDPSYDSSVTYLYNCKENIKLETLRNVEALCNDNYYTKALEVIDEVKNIIGTDNEIISKIEDIKSKRDTFIAMQKSNTDSTKTNSTIDISTISTSNINELSLESQTSYLIHVDLSSQKTNIYSGKKNTWKLIKSFICSTGIKDEETPKGSFTVKDKGEWFFSEKYNQGGKYWVQFLDNYLFHSLPYDKTKNNIVDYTLGTPSSHGCIRLSESDSKWLYDNIPNNTKVIIK